MTISRKRITTVVLGILILLLAGVLLLGFNQQVYADESHTRYALAFEKYVITGFDATTKVYDPRGAEVEITDGSFIPLRAGEYRIVTRGVSRYVTVFLTVPETQFSFSDTLPQSLATGEMILLPEATLTSPVITDDAEYHIFVEKDGKVISSYKKGKSNIFRPLSSGVYTIVYSYTDIFGYIKNKSFEITVEDRAAVSFLPPPKLAFGKEVKLGDAYAVFGQNSVKAQIQITAPDGSGVALTNNAFTVNQKGTYTIVVSGEVSGETVSKTYTVPADVYSENLFNAVRFANAPVAEVDLPDYSIVDGKGVMLKASTTGAVYRFSNIIDLNSLNPADNLVSFIPYVVGDIGYVEDLVFVLTDLHDPYNQISIQFKRSPFHDNLTYVTGAHNGRHYAFDNENWILTGVNGPVKIGDKYFFGGVMRNRYSMIGKSHLGVNLYSFSLDYAERRLILDLTSEGEGRYTLVDFDNPVWVGGSQYTWNGFTTGEAILSVEFGEVVGGSAAIVVTEVMGQSLSALNPEDNTPPSILIDFDEDYQKEMPFGVKNVSYPLPDAVARDNIWGALSVKKTLTLSGQSIEITGSSFTPTQAGKYILTYSATDPAGNTASKTLEFDILDSMPQIGISLEMPQSIEIDEYLPVPPIIVTGTSGKYTLIKEYSLNGRKLTPDSAGNLFIDETGILTVKVSVSDFLNNSKEQTFTLPVSLELPKVTLPYRPSVVKAGQQIILEDAILSDFNNKSQRTVTQKKYVNGELIQGSLYIVGLSATQLAVTYEIIVEGVGTVVEEYEADVVGSSLAEIFETSGTFTLAGNSNDEVHFVFNSDGYVALKNPVSHNNLRVSVSAPVKNFGYLDIYLSDYNRSTERFFIRITEYSATHSRLQLNGKGDYYILRGSLSAGEPVTFFYDCEKRNIKEAVTEKEIFKIDYTSDGNVFNGFSSGAVNFRAMVGQVAGASRVRINAISNENFVTFNLTGNDINPAVIITPYNREELTVPINSDYLVKKAWACDVLKGVFPVKVKVYDPQGNVIAEKNPANSDFVVRLNEYGDYVIVYEVALSDTLTYSMNEVFLIVKDTEKPVISLEKQPPSKVKLGATITLPAARVTDNVTKNLKATVIVYDPNYKNVIVAAGSNYRFMFTGVYRIVYTAADEAGNIARNEYYVEVER